ncbi:hypothetical protein [Acetivibrio cellulolyticus]|uniref:hypothetical protein n=1 Tax=Acetivibrio cellulolyticus TaxID=35830 RepID=UPI000312508C|nr:hypothetical protein [Acetivibrio cellulolyticus]
MKKLVLFIPLVVLIFISVILINGKTNISNSEAYEDNKQISALINGYSTEYNHEYKFATKKIEQILYGKWQVGDTVGYSLKYDITGGALDNGTIELSKTHFIKSTLSGSMYEYKKPVFVYYNETVEQMAKDDILGNFSGIEGIKPDTMGTVVVVMAISPHSINEYDFISTKFIIINNYVIAVDMYSFYQLQKCE